MNRTIILQTKGQGLYEITSEISDCLESFQEAGKNIESGLCLIFIQHTSASLVIQENADPSARRDLERWFSRLVPEDDRHFTHTAEGPDDMPSHIKSALTHTSLSVPIVNGSLALGTWQGIYVWEHRRSAQRRSVVVSCVA